MVSWVYWDRHNALNSFPQSGPAVYLLCLKPFPSLTPLPSLNFCSSSWLCSASPCGSPATSCCSGHGLSCRCWGSSSCCFFACCCFRWRNALLLRRLLLELPLGLLALPLLHRDQPVAQSQLSMPTASSLPQLHLGHSSVLCRFLWLHLWSSPGILGCHGSLVFSSTYHHSPRLLSAVAVKAAAPPWLLLQCLCLPWCSLISVTATLPSLLPLPLCGLCWRWIFLQVTSSASSTKNITLSEDH